MSFVEIRLQLDYDFGAEGGRGWNTEVVETGTGHERRNQRWADPLGSWQLGNRTLKKTQLEYLVKFFNSVRGRAVGFRYKDWNDYEANAEALVITGAPTADLIKTYIAAGDPYARRIHKPVNPITVARNGSPLVPASVDYNNGVVTFAALSSADIASIVRGVTTTINTTDAHGLAAGAVVWLSGIGGTTCLNNAAYSITVVDADTFTVDFNSTACGAYTAGGTAKTYPQPTDLVLWSGEFDVPARFDVDLIRAQFLAYREADGEAAYDVAGVVVRELRL